MSWPQDATGQHVRPPLALTPAELEAGRVRGLRRHCPLCGTPLGLDPGQWVPVKVFAQEHRISRSTTWRWISRGYLDAQKIDGLVRVREAGHRP